MSETRRFQQKEMGRDLNNERIRPVYLLRPRLFMDGNSWCALYGENIQDGICAFGDTPAEAAERFDAAYYGEERNGKDGPRKTTIVEDGAPEDLIEKQKRVGWWAAPTSTTTPEGEQAHGFFVPDSRAATFSTDPGFRRHKMVPCWIDEE
jgi:hypothetical protein